MLVEKLEVIVLSFSYIQPLATVEAKPVNAEPSPAKAVAVNVPVTVPPAEVVSNFLLPL